MFILRNATASSLRCDTNSAHKDVELYGEI